MTQSILAEVEISHYLTFILFWISIQPVLYGICHTC